MSNDTLRIGAATAIAFALLWIACSLAVFLAPVPAMTLTAHMLHVDLSKVLWEMNWAGFLIGLVAWPLTAGTTAWLIAAMYRRLA